MTYEMIKAMLTVFLDIGTIICLFWAGKPDFFKIPIKNNLCVEDFPNGKQR